jgi:hypothetical protein
MIYLTSSSVVRNQIQSNNENCLNHILKLMKDIEERNLCTGGNSSEKGDEFLSWSALIFIYATFIYGYRHDI